MRDLVGGEPVGIVQQQNRFIRIGQIGNVALDAFAHFVLLDDCERRRALSVGDGQLFGGCVNLALYGPRALAQPVYADVSRNLVEPAC